MSTKSKAPAAATRMSFDLAEMEELLHDHFADEATEHDVIHMAGPPGVGKSSIVKQVAKRLGYDGVITIMAAQRAREDLTGPPFLVQPEDPHGALGGKEPIGYSKFYPPKELIELTQNYTDQQRALHNAKRAALISEGKTKDAAEMGDFREPGPQILFLDEFMNAQPDVQTVYHSLILDRTFGDAEYKLRDNVRVVAASNRREDGAHVYNMSAPLATRLTHVTVRPTVPAWLSWARDVGIYEPIRAFIKASESRLGLDGIDVSIKSEAQPTPRSWEKASNKCKMKAYQFQPGDSLETKNRKLRMLQGLIEGTVGAGAAAEFIKFLEYARKAPTAEEIAANPDKISTFEDQPDICFVAVENMISGARRNVKWITPFLKYSKRLPQQFRALFEPEMMNLNGGMSEEALLAVLESEEFDGIQETSGRLDRVLSAADESKGRRGKR